MLPWPARHCRPFGARRCLRRPERAVQAQRPLRLSTAVRALAFKWQRIIWRCWQDRKPYDERLYEAALRRHGSPVVALFDRVELGKSPWKNPAKKN